MAGVTIKRFKKVLQNGCINTSSRHSIVVSKNTLPARVAELADAPGLGPGIFGCRGSSPLSRTLQKCKTLALYEC